MHQDRESQAFLLPKKNNAHKAPVGCDGHFNSVGSGNHFLLHTSWKHLMVVPKCMDILSDESQWCWKTYRGKLKQRGDLYWSVYSCLVTAGPNWKETKHQLVDELNKFNATSWAFCSHQRTDQQHREQHRTSQKHSPPPEEAGAGAHITWLQTHRVHGGLSHSTDRSQHHRGKAGWKDLRTVSVTMKMPLPWLGGFLCDCFLLN